MALNHAFGVVQWASSATVGTTYTVDLPAGFDLKAIRFYHSGQSSSTDAVTSVVSAQVGLGFATGTAARRALVNFYNDGDTNNATGAGVRNDCVAMTVPASGAPLGLLDVSSFSAEQFVLRVDDQNTTSLTVAWEAWGGSDITVATVGDFGEPAATGVQSYSVTGFTAAGTDQVVMLAGNNITAALNTNQDAYGASIYCGYFTGSDSAQNVVVAISAMEAANADTYRYCQTGECVATITPSGGSVSARAIGNFATDAFELNWLSRSVTDRRSIFLAMKGGQWRAGAYTIDGATLNATATVSGLPFQPAGLDFIGTVQTQPAAGVSNALGRLSFGVAASTTSRQSMGVFAQDNSANSEITLAIEYDQALVHVTVGAVLSAYDLSAINSDGFTVIVDDAGGPSTEWQGYLAFAGEGGPTLITTADTLTPSLTESLAVLVVAGLADTLTPTVSDATALLASLGLADTLTPSLTDAAALAAAVALVDTLTPGLAEVAAVLAAVAVAETLTPSLAESASVAGSVTPVSLSDTLTPSLTGSTALVALLGLADTLTPAVAEALQAAGAVALVDALTPSLGAALSTLTAVAVADVATPSLTDAAAVLVAQALADTLTPALAESASVTDMKALTDTLTPALTEVLTVVASAIAAGLPVMRILIPDDARLIHVPDDARLILIPEGLK